MTFRRQALAVHARFDAAVRERQYDTSDPPA
jgi:hypothetical protein